MNIFVIDGTFGNRYDTIYQAFLKANPQHHIKRIKVESSRMAYCTGCWSCWVKTPGLCAHNDDTQNMLAESIKSDYVIQFTENSVGYITSLSKKALEKHIPLIHPYLEVVEGECHHKKRYETTPRLGLVYINPEQNEKDYENSKRMVSRMALNLRSDMPFSVNIDPKVEVNYECLRM